MINQHLSLYRKYRPISFDQIIGQYFIVKTLKLAIQNQNISHAYIFSGTRGSGKTSIAKIFAKGVNCLNFDNDVCNVCNNCKTINDNLDIDIIELDAASNNGVNEIKELIDTVKYSPSKFKYKVYIIDEAHMLSTSAWNALLKTIEEPPQHVIFIFATTEFYKIPTTIVSRCQRYDFTKLSVKELEQLITYVCDSENILIANNAKNKIALLSDGGARDCLSILDQLANYSNKNIQIEDVENIFGITSNQNIIDLINGIIKNDHKQIFAIISSWETKNIDYLWLINQIINLCMDKAIYLKTQDCNLLTALSTNEIYALDCDDYLKMINIIEVWKECYENIKKYGNSKFYFDLTLLKFNLSLPNINYAKNEEVIEKNTNQIVDIKDVFITETVTNKFKKDLNDNNEINDLSIKQQDNYDFNYMIDESKKIINPYSHNINEVDSNANETSNQDWLNIFMSIACNSNSEIKKFDANNLLKFKSDYFADTNIDMLLKNIEKILVSSKNGFVILFNYKNEADKFNQYFWNPETYNQICEKLNAYNRVIFAIDKRKANEWLEIYKNNKDKQYEDVQLSLLKYLHKNIENNDHDDLKQKIMDILNKE